MCGRRRAARVLLSARTFGRSSSRVRAWRVRCVVAKHRQGAGELRVFGVIRFTFCVHTAGSTVLCVGDGPSAVRRGGAPGPPSLRAGLRLRAAPPPLRRPQQTRMPLLRVLPSSHAARVRAAESCALARRDAATVDTPCSKRRGVSQRRTGALRPVSGPGLTAPTRGAATGQPILACCCCCVQARACVRACVCRRVVRGAWCVVVRCWFRGCVRACGKRRDAAAAAAATHLGVQSTNNVLCVGELIEFNGMAAGLATCRPQAAWPHSQPRRKASRHVGLEDCIMFGIHQTRGACSCCTEGALFSDTESRQFQEMYKLKGVKLNSSLPMTYNTSVICTRQRRER